jgi:hypothetical protein
MTETVNFATTDDTGSTVIPYAWFFTKLSPAAEDKIKSTVRTAIDSS